MAVDCVSKFVHVRIYRKAGREQSADFFEDIVQQRPYQGHTVLTDNGTQFAKKYGITGAQTVTYKYQLINIHLHYFLCGIYMNRIHTTLNRLGFRSTPSSPPDQLCSSSQLNRSEGKGKLNGLKVFQKSVKERFARVSQHLHVRGSHASVPANVTQGKPSFKMLSTFDPPGERDARNEEALRNNGPEANESQKLLHVDEDGHLKMSSLAGHYIEERLNHPRRTFDEVTESNSELKSNDGLRFQDRRGRDFHAQQTRNMAGVLRSSLLLKETDTRPATPGQEHFGVISGVHVSRSQHQYRLQGTQVHQYDDDTDSWRSLDNNAHYQRIARGADGRVHGVEPDALDVSVSPEGYRFDLLRQHHTPSRLTVSKLPPESKDFATGDDHGVSLQLRQTDNSPFRAKRIAHASEDTLYAINKQNELFISERLPLESLSDVENRKEAQEEQTYFYLASDAPEERIQIVTDRSGRLFEASNRPGENGLVYHNKKDPAHPGIIVAKKKDPLFKTQKTELTVKMKKVDISSIEKKLKSSLKIDGFMHDHNNQLNLLAKDQHGNLHNILMGRDNSLQCGWNLADAIVMTNVKGLSPLVEYEQTIDLGRRGNLALDDQTLVVQGADDAYWRSTPIGMVDKLGLGLDNMAYILRHGKLRQLDVKHTASRMPVSDMYEISANQRRTRVELGETIAGSKNSEIRSFAVVDKHHFLTLSGPGALTAHIEGRRVELPLPAGISALKDIAIDGSKAIHVLDDKRNLHSLPYDQWQRLLPSAEKWEQIPDPGTQPVDGLATSAARGLIARVGDQHFNLDLSSPEAPELQRISGTLRRGHLSGDTYAEKHEKSKEHIRGAQHSNACISKSHNLLGSGGEGGNVFKHRHFLSNVKSHFHSVKSSRGASSILKQRFYGHSELQPLYDEVRDMVQLLPEMVVSRPAQPVTCLEKRLKSLKQKLAGRDDGQSSLLKSLKKQGQKLEARTHDAIILLGDLHGVEKGLLDPKKRQDVQNNSRKLISKKRPPNMLADIHHLLESYPVADDKPTARAMSTLLRKGLHIEYPDDRTRRDRHDPSIILRASLIQNCSTIMKLHDIAGRFEEYPTHNMVDSLKQEFDRIIYDKFDISELQQYAAANFSGYNELEKINSAHKTLARELGTTGAALNNHLEHQFNDNESNKRKGATQALATQVRSMQESDIIKLSAGKTTTFSTPLIFLPIPSPMPVYTAASGWIDISGEMKIERHGEGARLNISRKKSVSFSNNWGAVLLGSNGLVDPPMASTNEKVGPGMFSGINLAGALKRSTHNELSMDVHGNDIHRVMNHFSQPNARLLDLLAIGRKKMVSQAVTHLASLDLNVTPIDVRINLGDHSSSSIWFRAALGLSGDISLMNYEREHRRDHGPNGEYEKGIRRRTDYLPRIDTNAFLRPAQGAAATDHTFQSTPLEISSTRTWDRSRSETFIFSFKTPEKLTKATVDKLIKEIRQVFPEEQDAVDNILNTADAAFEQGNNNEDKKAISSVLASRRLVAMGDYASIKLSKRKNVSEEQHATLQTLARLVRQQTAFDRGVKQFSSATTIISLPSAKGPLQPQKNNDGAKKTSMPTALGSRPKARFDQLQGKIRDRAQQPWLKGVSDRNRSSIRELMVQQPRFAELVQALEGKNTAAEAELELKPSVREAIEDQALSDDVNIESILRQTLQNPENLRIRSISVSHTISAPSTFAKPPFLIGFRSGANLEYIQQRGIIEFEYGIDPDCPIAIRSGGGFALEDNSSPAYAKLLQRDVSFQYLSNATSASDDVELGHEQNTSERRGPSYQPVARPNQGPL